jgi:hypothetical protein
MKRSNSYEAAFEGWLQEQQLCYVAVDETRRTVLGGGPVKSLDFIVHGPHQARLLIDVKGRQFPSGPPGKRRRVWECWTSTEDIDCLVRWTAGFGPGYVGLFVFAYHLLPEVEMAEDTTDLFAWRGENYLFRAVDVDDYRRHIRVRSPKWRTVSLPGAKFRDLVVPVSEFTHAVPCLPEDCPF